MDQAAFLKAITRPIPTMPVDVIREAGPPETGAVIVKKPPRKSKGARKNAKRTAYQREYQREYMRKKRAAAKAECKPKQPQ